MPFEGFIWVGQRSRSHGLDKLSLDNLLVTEMHLPFKGKMEYDSKGKSFYDGDWVNNVRHGWGTRQYPSGNMYQGMWFNNVRHGEGTMKWVDKDQIYTGQWENGIQVFVLFDFCHTYIIHYFCHAINFSYFERLHTKK